MSNATLSVGRGLERLPRKALLLSSTALTGAMLAAALTLPAGIAHAQQAVVADGVDVVLDGLPQPIAGVKATNGGNIEGEGAEISLSGAHSAAVRADSGGTIGLTGGTVDKTGINSLGLRADGEGSAIRTDGVDITVTSRNAIGAQATNGGEIELRGGKLSVSVEDVNARHESDGALKAVGLGSRISAFDLEIEVTGSEALNPGISGGVRAQDGAEISLDNVSIKTTGLTHGIRGINGGAKVTGNAIVETSGNGAVGVHAYGDATVELTGGGILTSGDGSDGLFAEGAGSTITSNVDVTTEGRWAHGAHAVGGGAIDLAGGEILTGGANASGLMAEGAGSKIVSQANITTTGEDAHGAYAHSGGEIDLNSGEIRTKDDGTVGLFARGRGSRITSQANVFTTGDGAHGAYAADRGRIDLTGGSVSAAGEGAAAVRIKDRGRVTASGADLTSEQGAGVEIRNGGRFSIENGEISSAGPTFDVSFSRNAWTVISVGEGGVATDNNDVLLNVTREGDGRRSGRNGKVVLTLEDGSVTEGDILDEDTRGRRGWTDVVIDNGAQWTGRVSGIRNFTSENGGADFSAGSQIGADVRLGNGARTSGGSTDNPIGVDGNVHVDETSKLGGNWNIGGDLNADGTVSPGNSIGVINVAGDLNLVPASIYEVDVTAANGGESDLINVGVGGTANLDGTVRVLPLNGPDDFLLGHDYTIVTAEGGIGSQFAEVAWNHPSAFLEPTLTYDTNNAYLSIERNGVAFASAAETKNQRAAARGLDSLSFGNGAYDAVSLLSAAQAPQAFDALSGEIHASAKSALLDESRYLRDAVTGRLRQAAAAGGKGEGDESRPISGTDLSAWVHGFGSWGELDGNRNAAQLDREIGGIVVGIDGAVSENVRLGVAAGYSHSSYDADARNSSAKVDSYHVAAYGGVQFGGLGLRLGAAHAWHDVDTKRSVSIGAFSDRTKADYDARTVQVFGEVGYALDAGDFTLEPFAGMAYVNLHTDDIRERGGDAALRGDDRTRDIGYSTLGLRGTAAVPVGDGMQLGVTGMVGWRHAYGDVTPSAVLGFAGGSDFKVEGAPIARDAAVLEAGLSLGIAENVSVGVSYSGQLADDAEDHGITGNITFRF